MHHRHRKKLRNDCNPCAGGGRTSLRNGGLAPSQCRSSHRMDFLHAEPFQSVPIPVVSVPRITIKRMCCKWWRRPGFRAVCRRCKAPVFDRTTRNARRCGRRQSIFGTDRQSGQAGRVRNNFRLPNYVQLDVTESTSAGRSAAFYLHAFLEVVNATFSRTNLLLAYPSPDEQANGQSLIRNGLVLAGFCRRSVCVAVSDRLLKQTKAVVRKTKLRWKSASLRL